MLYPLKECFGWDAEATRHNLFFYPVEQLSLYARDVSMDEEERAECVAELFAREFLNKGCAEQAINSILTNDELEDFWCKAYDDILNKKQSGFLRNKLWEPDPGDAFSSLCEIAVRERLRVLCQETSGFIPVIFDPGTSGTASADTPEKQAFFIPFHFEKITSSSKKGGIFDIAGRPVPDWQAPYDRLPIGSKYNCIVHCDQSQNDLPQLTGDSLMLPLYLAFLQEEKIIEFDHTRLVATGAIDQNGRLQAVDTKTKAMGFHDCFQQDHAFFFFPESREYCIPRKTTEIPLRTMRLDELTGCIQAHIEAKGLVVPSLKYAQKRLEALVEERNTCYNQWDVMLARIENNMKTIDDDSLGRRYYLLALMLKSSVLCHMGRTGEAVKLNREAQRIAGKNHSVPEMLRLKIEELVELQDEENFKAVAAIAGPLLADIKNARLEKNVRTDLLMRYYGTMGQAHAYGYLGGVPGFSPQESKKCFENAWKCATRLFRAFEQDGAATENEQYLALGNVAQDLNYRFLWYALFEPETEEAGKAYQKAENHIRRKLQGKPALQDINRRFLQRLRAFSLYRYWLRTGIVPDLERIPLIDKKGGWLAALTGKYAGALLAASGREKEASKIFKVCSGIIKADQDDPIIRFIQMTICCEAFRSTGDPEYREKARGLLAELRKEYPAKSIGPWKRFLQGKEKDFPGWNYWY